MAAGKALNGKPYAGNPHVRFERIFYLLSHTSKPIGAIADFAGYKSPESLRRLFLKKTGMTMSEWREKHSPGR